MTHQEASLIGRLCEAERPRGFNDWEGREGYYVTACRISADDVPSLIQLARRWADPGDGGCPARTGRSRSPGWGR